MKPNSFDIFSGYLMWRCPYGKEHCSKCKNNCMASKYENIAKTQPEWDILLYTNVSRSTDAYKKIYNQRTATKRIKNRILNDYCLIRMLIHPKKHYSFMKTMIGICIYLNTRHKQQMQVMT